MFNLQQLKVFVSIADHKTLTMAAEALRLKQPTVSFHLKKLEESMGVQLYEHKHKRVLLTEEGKALLHYARRILAWCEEAERTVAEYREYNKAQITLGASSTPATYLLPNLLGPLRQVYPRVDISLHIRNSPQLLEMVKKGELDFGIAAEHEIHDPDLTAIPLCLDELGLIVCPDHPLAQTGTVRLDMLQSEYWILREIGSASRRMTDLWMEKKGFGPMHTIELGATEAIKRAVQNRLGVAILSKMAVEEEVSSGRLAFLSFRTADLERYIYFIYQRNRVMTPILSSIVEFFSNNREHSGLLQERYRS